MYSGKHTHTEQELGVKGHIYSLTLANFPWLEPLVLILIRNSKVAHSALVLQSSAVGLINERIQSKEPPKVYKSHTCIYVYTCMSLIVAWHTS